MDEYEKLLSLKEAIEVLRDRGFKGKDESLRRKLNYHINRKNLKAVLSVSGYYVSPNDLQDWLDSFEYKDGKPIPLTYRCNATQCKRYQGSYQCQLPQHLELTTIAVPRKYKEDIKAYVLEFVAEQEAEG